MRLNFLAPLILAPALLHAQTPAQNANTLQARLEPTNALDAAAPINTPATLRISTGVVAPKVIQSVPVVFDAKELSPISNKVVLDIALDAQGTPQQVRVIQSLNNDLDARVVEAIRQYRFQPATLDAQPIPVQMHLSVVLQPTR